MEAPEINKSRFAVNEIWLCLRFDSSATHHEHMSAFDAKRTAASASYRCIHCHQHHFTALYVKVMLHYL